MGRKILRRMTKERKIILEELRKVKTHPTAYEVLRMTAKKLPSISFGTIYRNLNLLREQGEILELICGKYSCRYDGTTAPHYHFCCLKCKKVFDVDEPILKDLDKRISRSSGFQVEYHRIDFYGYCDRCKFSKK